MKSTLRLFLTCCALCALAVVSARASEEGETVLDSGRLVLSSGGRVVATEEFEYVLSGDSVTVSAVAKRKVRNADGTESDFTKRMALVVDAGDFGLRSYLSNLEFAGHVQVKGVIPGDTSMTVYAETDGGGTADRLIQPPGRLFVMDPGMFTLFDVICHNLKGKTFAKRPINVIALADSSTAVEATVTLVGADTVSWGGRRTATRKLQLSDPSGSFLVWMNDKGQMLRFEHPESGLVVMREAPAPPKPARPPVARKPAARK